MEIKQITKIALIAESVLFLAPMFFLGSMAENAAYMYCWGWFFMTAIVNLTLIVLHLIKRPNGYVVSVVLLLIVPFIVFFIGVYLLLIGRGW